MLKCFLRILAFRSDLPDERDGADGDAAEEDAEDAAAAAVAAAAEDGLVGCQSNYFEC